MNGNQRVKINPINSFWGIMPKMIFSVIAAIVVPTLAFFALMLLILIFFILYSMVFEPQTLRFLELPDAVVAMFGEALSVTAYVGPCTGLCAGPFGFLVAIIGWGLQMIQKRTSVVIGSVLGIICAILFELILFSGTISYSPDGIPYIIDGSRTLYGWIEFVAVVIIIGFLGGLGGYSFWFVWDRSTPKVIGNEDSS